MYACSIDLKMLPLGQRNKIVDLIRKSRAYYKLESQVISTDFDTMKNIMKEL